MSYYNLVLQPGETVKLQGRLHWIIYRWAIFCVVLSAIGFAVWAANGANIEVLQPDSGADQATSTLALVVAISCIFYAVTASFVAYIQRRTTEIVITDKRVLLKKGLLSRRTIEMNMSKIETVDVQQSILGRMFNAGSVCIRGTGSGLEILRFVEDPLGLRNAILVG